MKRNVKRYKIMISGILESARNLMFSSLKLNECSHVEQQKVKIFKTCYIQDISGWKIFHLTRLCFNDAFIDDALSHVSFLMNLVVAKTSKTVCTSLNPLSCSFSTHPERQCPRSWMTDSSKWCYTITEKFFAVDPIIFSWSGWESWIWQFPSRPHTRMTVHVIILKSHGFCLDIITNYTWGDSLLHQYGYNAVAN